MSGTPERVKCWKCGVTFAVAKPIDRGAVETTVCREANCGRRFWHGSNAHGGSPARTGVWPEDAHRFVEVPT